MDKTKLPEKEPLILRASSDGQKFEKKDQIIKMAEQLLKGHHYDLPSVNEIIQSLNIAKGTFYLYFNTKEEIYLEILRNYNRIMFDLLERCIDSTRSSNKLIENISRLLLDFSKNHPTAMMLSSISAAILEANLEIKYALSYKTMIVQRMGILVTKIASKMELPQAKIKNNIIVTYVLWIALWQHNNPPENIKKLLSVSPLNELVLDLDKTFISSVMKLWKED
jgi:AcrR family transcriptional regulator